MLTNSLRLVVLSCIIHFHESWTFPRLRRWFDRNHRVTFLNDSQDLIDNYFMSKALEEAKNAAIKYNEVPIGAIIVRRDEQGFQILAQASNRVETFKDASAHAELLALRKAGRNSHNWRLLNTTLYSTLEPCPLCLSASLNFRVSRIVYGAPDHRLGAIETFPNNLIEQHPFHTIHDIQAGVLQNQSTSLLQEFFRQQRSNKKRRTKTYYR
jgi:tRNA(adenine34) deaminase